MSEEFKVFEEFVCSKGLRHTHQREEILRIFLSTERHVSVEELYKLVRKKFHNIGYTTVYRTMKLLYESGLCGEIDFGDGIRRFEHRYGHGHHDHLICTECGRFFEVMNPEIERLQDSLAGKYHFTPAKHKLEIFGICKKCKKGGGYISKSK